MVTCPRCQQPVDETVRTTCPLCFTPILQASHASGPLTGLAPDLPAPPGPQGYQAPAANPGQPYLQADAPQPVMTGPVPPAPRPLMNPGARISLTGEVIEAGAQAAPPPIYAGGGGPGPAASPRAKSAMMRPLDAAPEKAGGSGTVGLVVALLVLLGGGIGGYFWMMNRTNPKDQARAVYKALLLQDYKTTYELTALSPEAQKKYPNVEAFAADAPKYADSLGLLRDTVLESAKAAAPTATVGTPSITGDKADVPTSCTMSIMGREIKLSGTAHMKNDFGIWKLDRTGESEGSGSQAFKDLVGKPDMSSIQ